MSSIADDPTSLRAFVTVVDAGGFTAAAGQLSMTPSGVSKLITRLEEQVGVRLLNRTTRSIALTPEGELMASRGRRILAELEELADELSLGRMRPRGLVRLSTGFAFGMHQLLRVLPEFRKRYPDIELTIDITDRIVDLTEEHMDIAVRMGPLKDSSLIARPIAEFRRIICAAPAYLKKHGTPRTPADLRKHQCLTIATAPNLRLWPFAMNGAPETVEVHGAIAATNAEAVLQLAMAGMGIIRLGDLIVGAAIKQGLLVPLLTDTHIDEPMPIHAVYPPGRYRSLRVQAVVDFLVETFGHAPWRDVSRVKRTAPIKKK